MDALATAVAAMSGWEAAAVALGIAYLLLAMRENALCWYAAFVSTAIYLVLFWQVSLLMESLLQVYYLIMAVYGWWQWRHGGEQQDVLPISRWSLHRHAVVIGSVLLCSVLVGYALDRFTAAALPYLDSFTTIGAVVTTWMVARKILENWLYWLVIDGASIVLYVDRGLYLTALLFGVYLVIVVFGFFEWRRHYRSQSS